MSASEFIDERALSDAVVREPIRAGFGRGLLEAGRRDSHVVALCADLVESTQMHLFKKEFPERFFEVGVAEQNLVTVAAGMAALGTVPFTTSYAAFSPGRNWEQIKTTAALNRQPVKIVGSHAGVSVGPDGATHQMLEDIALMRVMPNMAVIAPADSREAERATLVAAIHPAPVYIRLAREATPVFTGVDAPFELGKAYVLRSGTDITLAATGTMTYQFLLVAQRLALSGISAEVLHVPTVKPLDEDALLASAAKTRLVVTGEEAQAVGGLGGAIAEALGEKLPTRVFRIGMKDRYGESGDPAELMERFGLAGKPLFDQIGNILEGAGAAFSKY